MIKKGFEIVKGNNISDELINYRDKYNEKGKYVGFSRFEGIYRMALGTCTDWTGIPRSGKTQVLMELLLNTSKFYGWRHLLYFPDVGNKWEVLSDLIHKYTGKSFNPMHKNAISDKEIYDSIEWITHHFLILTKKDVKANLTPFEFWDMAVEMKKNDPNGLHTACIDSWKDMHHDYNKYGGYAMYLEKVLPYRNQLAEDNNLHFHTVIHPKATDKVDGKRQMPTPYDLKGGSEWFNSGKCMVTVHRESVEQNFVDINFTKIKPRSNGTPGHISLNFDLDKFVYYEQKENGSRTYAQPEQGKPSINQIVDFGTIQTDFPFDQ